MRPELEEIRLLEDYLQDNLPGEQHQHVAIRLLWDRVWQRNLTAQQTAYRALRLAGRQQLRQELKAIHARLFR
jgi:hypothetical protein